MSEMENIHKFMHAYIYNNLHMNSTHIYINTYILKYSHSRNNMLYGQKFVDTLERSNIL